MIKDLFLKFFRPYAAQFVALLALVAVMAAATLTLPDRMARIINEGIIGGQQAAVWSNGGVMLLLALAAGLAGAGHHYLASRIAAGFSRDLRAAVFAKIESFSLHEFNTFSTASLITRTTGDVQQVMMMTGMLMRLAIVAPMMGLWAIVKAYHSAPSMAWIMGLSVGVLIAVIATLFAAAVPRLKTLQKLIDRLNLVSREILTGLRVIRAFNNEPLAERKFDEANRELLGVGTFVNRLMAVMPPAMMLIMNAASIAVVWFGARLIETGGLQLGEMLAFIQYAAQAIFSFLMMSIIFIVVPRAAVSAERISEVLSTEATIKDPLHPLHVSAGQGGRIEFDHVTFSYEGADHPVLHDITFTAEPGQVTALVGSTGSGKSTLVNLIPRFYDASEGAVRVDGINVRELRLEDLYARIGYVPQRGVLFSGSVESNLRYGAPNASDAEMTAAAEIAQAREFIEKLDGGYQAPIAQGGTNVSGGQKQRLSIARAILRRPEIFIFDDSFSALDFATDAKLRQALAAATQQRTVVIVAQRISTVMGADKIVVINEGWVVGEGTHEQLLKNCSVYREIASSQLSEEELKRHAI
jgi:ATP-binding cassette subfamily B protein